MAVHLLNSIYTSDTTTFQCVNRSALLSLHRISSKNTEYNSKEKFPKILFIFPLFFLTNVLQ